MPATTSPKTEPPARLAGESIQAYLVGGGIASLAAAVYLIRDGRLPGKNIHVFEASQFGGSLDASGSATAGYSMRGSRMFGPAYVLTYELLAGIPSLDDPAKSVTEDTFEFWQAEPWSDRARLVEQGAAVDVSHWGLSNKDRIDLMGLMLRPEAALGTTPIAACFEPHFFETHFWLMWCSMFGFETWHSATELRRYLLRFLRLFPDLESLQVIQSTRYNGFDAIVRPLVRWLLAQGVHMETGVAVTDMHLEPCAAGQAVRHLDCLRSGASTRVEVGPHDLVIATLGSMTANASLGSMDSSPSPFTGQPDASWALWERLAAKNAAFGNPAAFCGHVEQTRWVTFTVTDTGDLFARHMAALSASPAGRGGLVTLVNSNWRLTFHLFHPPAYADQPANVQVWWGYGLLVDCIGNFVPKTLLACSGKEILVELFSHLALQDDLDALLASANCIPCLLPYATSQFMPRAPGDRPAVLPTGMTHLALIGQYCEIPHDVVYTVEYSIHSARLAVTGLLGLKDEMPPTYQGLEHPNAMMEAIKMILR